MGGIIRGASKSLSAETAHCLVIVEFWSSALKQPSCETFYVFVSTEQVLSALSSHVVHNDVRKTPFAWRKTHDPAFLLDAACMQPAWKAWLVKSVPMEGERRGVFQSDMGRARWLVLWSQGPT